MNLQYYYGEYLTGNLDRVTSSNLEGRYLDVDPILKDLFIFSGSSAFGAFEKPILSLGTKNSFMWHLVLQGFESGYHLKLPRFN